MAIYLFEQALRRAERKYPKCGYCEKGGKGSYVLMNRADVYIGVHAKCMLPSLLDGWSYDLPADGEKGLGGKHQEDLMIYIPDGRTLAGVCSGCGDLMEDEAELVACNDCSQSVCNDCRRTCVIGKEVLCPRDVERRNNGSGWRDKCTSCEECQGFVCNSCNSKLKTCGSCYEETCPTCRIFSECASCKDGYRRTQYCNRCSEDKGTLFDCYKCNQPTCYRHETRSYPAEALKVKMSGREVDVEDRADYKVRLCFNCMESIVGPALREYINSVEEA